MATMTTAKTWRYEDLFDLPDDGKRYEIIDGELYEMPAPALAHAIALANLIARFLPAVQAIGAQFLTAPVDVFFPGANPVQPDFLVLLPGRFHLMSQRGIEGAPDLVVEILSPSNPEHDRITKRALYQRGGVREYWWASPEAATIEVLVLDGDVYRTHARAADDEPVSSTVLPGLSFPASAVFAPPVAA